MLKVLAVVAIGLIILGTCNTAFGETKTKYTDKQVFFGAYKQAMMEGKSRYDALMAGKHAITNYHARLNMVVRNKDAGPVDFINTVIQPQKAYAQTLDLSNDVQVVDVYSHAWIFVTSPDKYCERDVSALQADLAIQKSYLPYVGSYDVVCFPSGGDVMQVRQNVALIRTVYPHDKLMFTYDLRNPALARDFKLFLSTVDSFSHDRALGKAFITEGWAVSTFAGEVASHELSHLTTGKDHIAPDTESWNPATWKPYVSVNGGMN